LERLWFGWHNDTKIRRYLSQKTVSHSHWNTIRELWRYFNFSSFVCIGLWSINLYKFLQKVVGNWRTLIFGVRYGWPWQRNKACGRVFERCTARLLLWKLSVLCSWCHQVTFLWVINDSNLPRQGGLWMKYESLFLLKIGLNLFWCFSSQDHLIFLVFRGFLWVDIVVEHTVWVVVGLVKVFLLDPAT